MPEQGPGKVTVLLPFSGGALSADLDEQSREIGFFHPTAENGENSELRIEGNHAGNSPHARAIGSKGVIFKDELRVSDQSDRSTT